MRSFSIHICILRPFSGCTIAIIGVESYLKIKHYVKFKIMWTKQVASKLMFLSFLISLFQAVMIITGVLITITRIIVSIYIALDTVIVGIIVYLQIKTIRTSRATLDHSTVVTSEIIDKKITKLSMNIMLLLCFFVTHSR